MHPDLDPRSGVDSHVWSGEGRRGIGPVVLTVAYTLLAKWVADDEVRV